MDFVTSLWMNFYRTIFFMPNLIGGIVLGWIWLLIINGILLPKNATIITDAKYGFWGLVVLANWQNIGYMMVIYIAGIQTISRDLIEAALIDGATPPQTFFLVVLPMLKPTAITIAILNAMWSWNDYLLQYLTIGTEYKTIPVAIQYLRGGYGAVDMGAMMAMLVLAMLPIIIFYLFTQRYIIEGVVAGAVKG
jgi:raffinose/stachyose/melibiose transport system permease protein